MRRRCENCDGSARVVSCDESTDQNIPVITFSNNKRINTELFIDRKQGLYIQNDNEKTF